MITHLKGRETALEAFGWTGRKAEWIALVCLHSGVFTRAQLCDWLGIDRWRAMRFVRAMTERRQAADETVGGRKVCRISARGIYRALGAEHIRHRRNASPEVLLRRLLSLDHVIDRTDLPWLPTEAEKVAAFEALGIERGLLPVRVYRGAAGDTRRRFPLKLPVALDPARALFVYAEPGYRTTTALHSWGGAHRRLWRALRSQGRSVEVEAVVCTRREIDRTRIVLRNWTNAAPAPSRSAAPELRAAAREIARIERAIRGSDETVVAGYGDLQGCLVRIAELKDLLRSSRPGPVIDAFGACRSVRLAGGGP